MKFGEAVKKQNKYIVISIGGSVIFPKESTSIDFLFLTKIKDYFTYLLVKKYKIVIVPGGFGGQFFFDGMRELGCSELELNQVGTNLIEIASIALGRFLKETRFKLNNFANVSAFSSMSEFQIGIEAFDISIVGFTLTGATTSDSLAALIGSHIGGRLQFIKNLEANRIVVDYVTDFERQTFSVDQFKKFIWENDYHGKAGSSPLDFKLVEILKLTKLPSSVVFKEDLIECDEFKNLRIFDVEI